MRKITLTGIVTIMLSCPAVATVDITKNETNPGCNNTVLHTYSAPTSLEADYTPNTITLNWYNGNQKITPTNNTANTCTYDGTITLPTTNPTRTGYTFAGWQVRVASNNNQSGSNNQTTFDLSTIYEDAPVDYIWRSSLGDEGETNDGEEILNNGEWAVIYDDDSMVKGVSTCSTEHPTTPWYENNNTFTPDNFSTTLTANQYSLDNSSGMQYCWCKATSYTPVDENSGDLLSPLSVASALWVFEGGYDAAVSCAHSCAGVCANDVDYYDDFRSAVFGVTE